MTVIEKAIELGLLLQEEKSFRRMMLCKDANNNDNELQDMIGEFNLTRFNLQQEMSKPSRDEAKVAEMNEQLQSQYQTVMDNPNMAAYNIARQEMNLLMQQVNAILQGAMNGEDPAAIDLEAACGGDCASCAGCH